MFYLVTKTFCPEGHKTSVSVILIQHVEQLIITIEPQFYDIFGCFTVISLNREFFYNDVPIQRYDFAVPLRYRKTGVPLQRKSYAGTGNKEAPEVLYMWHVTNSAVPKTTYSFET